MNWLAFQGSFSLTFLILEWWDCSLTVSSVGAGAGISAVSAAISSLSSDSENREVEAVSDFVGWTQDPVTFSQNCAQHSF